MLAPAMITGVALQNFKSIETANIELGAFNLFIGSNGGGKSNFFESLRFLQGIGWGLSIQEILNGRPRTGIGSEWPGIRGGSRYVEWERSRSPGEPSDGPEIDVTVQFASDSQSERTYSIGFDAGKGIVRNEYFTGCWTAPEPTDPSLPSTMARLYRTAARKDLYIECQRHRPVLQQVRELPSVPTRERKIAKQLLEVFRDMQWIEPLPGILRQYATASAVHRMGGHGENFAALVTNICAQPESKEAYLEWLRQLRPDQIDDVTILHGALGEPLFALEERGHTFPAPVLSDGTLRFAAITAAFFQPSMPEMLILEEVETGLDASRLRVLVELLKNRAGSRQTKVLATSHSAAILDWLQEEDYEHVFLCTREPKGGITQITPLSEVPYFIEAAKETPPSKLIAEGWMGLAL